MMRPPQTEGILDSRAAWLRLTATLMVAMVGNVGLWCVVVVMPALQAEFGVDRAGASLPYMATMAGFAVGNVVVGRVVDRVGIAAALWIATGLMGAAYAATGIAGGFAMVNLFHVVIGLGTGACFGPLMADISHWFWRRRGIAVALVASGNYAAGAVWPLVLSGILESHGWRTVYLALAVIVVAALVPLSLALRARVPAAAMAHAEAASLARRSSIGLSLGTMRLLLALAGISCCVAMAMPQVHMVALAIDIGCAPIVGAQILSVMLLGGVVSRIGFGFVADKLGGVKTQLIGAALQCFALALYLPFDGAVTGLFVVSLIFGLAQGGIVPSYAMIIREYFPPREAGSSIGLVLMATIVGMALGGWMSGYIRDLTGSYTMAFANGIAFNLVNMSIMLFILGRTRQPRLALA
ncbi:MFS-type transporter [Stappia sp. 22II-S9-Z10]|nr:MFS-type transporter [Stappia sp. 22II-S9-Z10]